MRTYSSRSQHEPLYLSLEIDQFSAQVIAAYNPLYQRKPFVVVRQNADSHKSSVWACSALARRLHAEPGMPVHPLKKRHAELAVVPRDEELEKTACAELSRLIYGYTPEYEINEGGRCLLDLTGTPILRQGGVGHLAMRLKDEVHYKIGLEEIAIGISRSKLISRMMAKAARPDAVRICEPGQESDVLGSLDAALLPGLSPPCREKIKKYGLRKIGQIQRLGREALIRRFGMEGEKLYTLTSGVESDSGGARGKALYAETVLDRDINDRVLLVQNVRYTADKLCHGLKIENARTKRLSFILKYTDYRTVQKAALLSSPTNDFITIAQASIRLFEALYQRRVAIKSMKLVAGRPQGDTGQLDLFETDGQKRQRSLGCAITEIRKQMGFGIVLSASSPGWVPRRN